MFAFHYVFSNSLYCRVCLFILWRSHFADFVSFLSIFYEVLYIWCLRYNIYNSWFLDIRISTCLLQKYFTAEVFYYCIEQILMGKILTDTAWLFKYLMEHILTDDYCLSPYTCKSCTVLKQFDGLNFDGLVRKRQKRQNFPCQNFVLYSIWYIYKHR